MERDADGTAAPGIRSGLPEAAADEHVFIFVRLRKWRHCRPTHFVSFTELKPNEWNGDGLRGKNSVRFNANFGIFLSLKLTRAMPFYWSVPSTGKMINVRTNLKRKKYSVAGRISFVDVFSFVSLFIPFSWDLIRKFEFFPLRLFIYFPGGAVSVCRKINSFGNFVN